MILTEPPHEPAGRRWCDNHGRPFDVRPLAESDRAALLAFYEAFEPKRGAQGLPPKGTERLKRWLDSVLAHGIHLVALRDGELIGHALLMPTQTEGVSEYAIFLREDERGHGVGTELTRACIEVAREAGLHRLWLSVELQNRAAVRSYEKAGFRFLPGTIYSPEAEMERML
jgi:RimJ/RimL family protein N-acetyltransferase